MSCSALTTCRSINYDFVDWLNWFFVSPHLFANPIMWRIGRLFLDVIFCDGLVSSDRVAPLGVAWILQAWNGKFEKLCFIEVDTSLKKVFKNYLYLLFIFGHKWCRNRLKSESKINKIYDVTYKQCDGWGRRGVAQASRHWRSDVIRWWRRTIMHGNWSHVATLSR